MEHFPLKEKLHTDVLEAKYGPIHARVLKHTTKIREAHLEDTKGISRTFAITFFTHPWSKQIGLIDNEIKKGAPIGKTFREKGYVIRKNVIDVFVLKLPVWLKTNFKTKEHYAKARLSEFYAKKESSRPSIYGLVVEIYSPDFRHPVVNKIDLAQINATTQALKKAKVSMQLIWEELGKNNRWYTISKDALLQAKTDSLAQAHTYKEKIQKYLFSKK